MARTHFKRWGRSGYRKTKRAAKYYQSNQASVHAKAAKALAVARYVKGLVNVEFKHFDVGISTAASTTPVVTQLTNISQGDTTSQRNGNSIKAKSLHISGQFQINPTATLDRIRVLVIKNMTDDTPTWDDVIDGTSSIDQFRNLNKTNDLKVLSDRVINLTEPSFAVKSFKVNIPLSHHVKWDNNTTTMKGGHLYLMYLGSQATNTATVNMRTRLRYIDN